MEKIDYLALLRGINVGGKNSIKMDLLKKIFEEMKFTDIITYIQSGNVFFTDLKNEKLNLAEKIEKALLDKTKCEIIVKVLTLSDIKEIINGIPNDFGTENEIYKYDILFLKEPLTTKEVVKGIKPIESNDKIYEGEKAFYAKRIIEKLTGSYTGQISKKWSNIIVRNLNTTKKLYELMLDRNNNM